MRRLFLVTAAVLLVAILSSTVATAMPSTLPGVPVTVNFGTISRPAYVWPAGPTNQWNLTACDLTINYRLAMATYRPSLGTTLWTSLGVGNGTDPRGWMSSGAPFAAQALPMTFDLDDKLNLCAPGRLDEMSYDATGPNTIIGAPIGSPTDNYGIWFDRTGISPSQRLLWGNVNRVTYGTGGNYTVQVVYHAVSGGQGTMFATVNGIPTGFYAAGWVNAPPDFTPVGKSFTGDMTSLRAFAAVQGSGVRIANWTARGCH